MSSLGANAQSFAKLLPSALARIGISYALEGRYVSQENIGGVASKHNPFLDVLVHRRSEMNCHPDLCKQLILTP